MSPDASSHRRSCWPSPELVLAGDGKLTVPNGPGLGRDPKDGRVAPLSGRRSHDSTRVSTLPHVLRHGDLTARNNVLNADPVTASPAGSGSQICDHAGCFLCAGAAEGERQGSV